MSTTTAEQRPGGARRALLVTAVIVLGAAIVPGAGRGEPAVAAAEKAAWRAYVGAMQAGLLAVSPATTVPRLVSPTLDTRAELGTAPALAMAGRATRQPPMRIALWRKVRLGMECFLPSGGLK